MKKILSLLILTVLVVASCSKYDDTELRNKVNDYERRISALESLASYQTLLQKLDAGKTVTSYSKADNEITLTFSDGSSVTFNQKGEPGAPGESIQGEPGKTPEVKIENDKWYVRYGDDGTWKEIGSAIDRSLIQDIKVVGDVLQITLAGGTVVNVPFGEKEGYGFEVGGGRTGFCMMESVESFRALHVAVPYTLTGDLKNVEDASVVVVNISAFPDPWMSSSYTTPAVASEVEPTDAHSGNIIINMDRFRFDQELDYGWIDDPGQIMFTFPTLKIDAIAFFPDGTSAHKSFYCIGVRITCDDEYQNWYYGYDDCQCPCLDVESEAGAQPIWVRHYLMNHELYDGPDLPIIPFKDLYSPSNSGTMKVSIAYEDGQSFSWFNDEYKGIEYKMTYTYTANTSGHELYDDVWYYRKRSDTSGAGFMRFRLIQPK